VGWIGFLKKKKLTICSVRRFRSNAKEKKDCKKEEEII